MTTPRLYPFDEAMALGFGLLRLAPAVFWAMTPRELDAAIAGLTARAFRRGPDREDLAALMRRFPDHTSKDDGQ